MLRMHEGKKRYHNDSTLCSVPSKSKLVTHCSVKPRADSYTEKLPSESACETLVCVKEFTLGFLHIGTQVCGCGFTDIPF